MKLLNSLLATFVAFASAFALASHSTLSAHDALSGKELSVNLRDRVTAVVFMSARCPCSASHELVLKDLVKEFPEIAFVGIHSNTNETDEESKKHFAESQFPFTVLRDNHALIAQEFGALKTPHVFIVNKDGDVIYSGGITDSHTAKSAKKNYLKDALLSVRAGKNPDPKEVRTLGCVIERK